MILNLKSRAEAKGKFVWNMGSVRGEHKRLIRNRRDLNIYIILVQWPQMMDIGTGARMILRRLYPLELVPLFTGGGVQRTVRWDGMGRRN